MKNREPVLKKLDSIESKMAKLSLGLNRGDRETQERKRERRPESQ
jgi:hypothetical protein